MGIMSSFDVSSALSQTIFGTAGQSYPDTRRVPMAFTSTKRLRLLDPKFSAITNATQEEKQLLREIVYTEQSVQTPISNLLPIIEMAINPKSISWRQPKRIIKRDTQNGSIYFHFTNNKRQNNDILTLEFRGNTGNINYRGDIDSDVGALSVQSGINTGANKKALIWHNLYQLTREEILLEDNIINEFMVVYNSVIMPNQIMLIGHFNGVMDWADNADKPFSKDYSFSFTVTDTVPALDDLMQEISIVFTPENYVA